MKGNALSTTQRRMRHQRRLEWLHDPQQAALLARLPRHNQDVTPDGSAALDEAQRRMLHLKLFAPTSTKASVRAAVRLLVSELHGQTHPEWARK